MPRYWVGIDQGSTATKACLIDRRGGLRRLVSERVATRRPAPGWVEHDPEALAKSATTVLRRVLADVDPGSVGGIGIAAQRSTFLFWDPLTARPLTPALSWQDRRADKLCASLSRHEERIRLSTGLRLSPHYAGGKIRWLMERFPSLRRRAERGKALFGTVDTFLLYRLTRGASWSTDPTHAARTLLMDLERREWDPDLLEIFRVPLRSLPPIRPSAHPTGEIRVRGVSLPVTATLGDQQAALIGLGCLRRGEMAINYGTGAFVVLNTGKRPRRAPGLLTSVAWSSPEEVRYLLEGTINAAGSAVEWIRALTDERVGPRRSLPDLLELPVVIPAFSGLGAPHWIPSARGMILGLDLRARPVDLVAATFAGIACRVREIVERMRRSGGRPLRIVAGGGLAREVLLLRLQAGLLGRTLLHSVIEEGTVRGAALLAGHALGHWSLDKDPRLRHSFRPVAPGMPRADGHRYYARFRKAIVRLTAT